MSIKSKLVISLLFVSFIPIIFLIFFDFTSANDQLLLVQQRSLEAIADSKVEAINNYFLKFKDEMVIAKDNLALRAELPIVSRLVDQVNDPHYIRAKKVLDAQLQSWVLKRANIIDVMLLDVGGKVVYLLNNKHNAEFDKEFFDPSGKCFLNGKNDIYVSDIFLDQEDSDFSFHIFAPIHDLSNKFIGEIVFEVKAADLYAITNDIKGLGETGETFLGRLIFDGHTNASQRCSFSNDQGDNVLIISSLRYEPKALFNRVVQVGGPNGQPIQQAVQGKNGGGISVDYAGKMVLATWRYLPERHWGVVTKINLEELLLPSRRVVAVSLIFSLGVFWIIIAIASILAHTISLPIIRLTTIAKKVGKGELDVKFDEDLTSSRNEVGVLATTLAKTVDNLRDSYHNLEKRVRERTAQFEEAQVREEAILSSIGDGVVATDEREAIIFMNDPALGMLNLKYGEMVGKNITDFISIQDEIGNALKADEDPIIQALRFGKSTVLNMYPKIYYFIRKDKSRFPVALTATPVKLQDKIIGAIEVFRDITQEHQIDIVKTEFISLASHQLRTPLTAISWYAEMLLAGDMGKISREQRRFLNEIYKSDHRMLSLVNALLNVSRLELGTFIIEPEPTDILAITHDVISEMKSEIKKKKIKFTEDFDFSLPSINIDPRLTAIIIQNLLSNAVKFTPAKGSVTISIKNKKPDLLIMVSDTGCGIPKSDQSKIFTKLYRGDNVQKLGTEGTGLGLYLAKSIIQFMNGRIWFDSEENKGTTFYVTLPLAGVKSKKGTKRLE